MVSRNWVVVSGAGALCGALSRSSQQTDLLRSVSYDVITIRDQADRLPTLGTQVRYEVLTYMSLDDR